VHGTFNFKTKARNRGRATLGEKLRTKTSKAIPESKNHANRLGGIVPPNRQAPNPFMGKKPRLLNLLAQQQRMQKQIVH